MCVCEFEGVCALKIKKKCCPVLGFSKVRSTFDQLANLHSDKLRDLAPLPCMERSNGIPMEIFRLATRNEKKRTRCFSVLLNKFIVLV